MSDKLTDPQGRWRNRTVAFRVSPEEGERIDAQVAMSGLTKQDYITARLLEESVVVTPSSRVQRALQREAVAVYRELRRIRSAGEMSPELEARIRVLVDTFAALGADCSGASDVDEEDGLIRGMGRKTGEEGADMR